jgi:hypothetical protein
VEVLAARTLSLATLGARRRAQRRAQTQAELEALAGGSLLELRRTLPGRYWILAMLSLTGKSTREIASMVGYAGPAPVLKALRHPAVVKLVEEVRAAQLQTITSSYGVMAAAKAAAPAIAEHVAELAGGKKAADGSRLGRARRDADAIRAADLVLTLSGDRSSATPRCTWRCSTSSRTPSSRHTPRAATSQCAFRGSAGSSRRLRRPHCLPAVRAPRTTG